ncbi:MAG: MATE family efflux transporter [Gammaproteobacteria bacterium]|nr:MATE family efflux transporter [Gammaproteobacteria bacterium]MBV9621402.1 MATE family efflux transporter [Gammaproteobacteria bacterium]
MDAPLTSASGFRPPGGAAPLPAQRRDPAGGAHVDQRAIWALALPLMANSAVQIVLNLTDMWFMGRISTEALAAVGAVQWLVLVVVLVLGGAGTAVQTLVAQAFGARRYARAAQAVWTALWAMLVTAPLFVLVGSARHLILAPFGFESQIETLASAFWLPRVAGACVGAAVWALLGFFNGIGRPRVTLWISICTTVTNALLNQLFIFHLGWGIAGSAWATNAAQALGLLCGLAWFMRPHYRARYRTHLTWHLHPRRLLAQVRFGLPMGLVTAADLLGFAIFQMMQTRLGTAGGAATQMVVILTSLAYMPGFGIASAGTTLVGQSIGAGAPAWAMRVGNRIILLCALYMFGLGFLIALGGPWVLPFFAGAHDAQGAAAVAIGVQLLWLAAAYQFFDGLNMGSSMSLRGAGDVRVPAALVLPMSLLLFVPLAHAFTFAPGAGWVHFLPQFGWGAFGGWVAVLIYVIVLGSTLFLRWHSGAWQRPHL